LLLKADALSLSKPPHTSPANDACASSTDAVLDRLLFENRRVFFLAPAIILVSEQLSVTSCEETPDYIERDLPRVCEPSKLARASTARAGREL
jgi:hypothetical protein